jgi:PAS domain S-box-containing protein
MRSARENIDDLNQAQREIHELRRREACLAAQKEAFQAAVGGAALEQSLGILVRTAVDQIQGAMRCGFCVTDESRTKLHHVVGLPEDYAKRLDGFRIGLDSLGCGLAVATNQPVITPDVYDEPRWKPWLRLAEEYDYRAVWSIPVQIEAESSIGTFVMYFREPRETTAADVELARVLAHAGAIIISRHHEAQQRARIEKLLRDSEERLRLAVEASQLAMWDWNVKTGEMVWNDELYRLFGYRFGEIEPSYAAWATRVHPDDRDEAREALEMAFRDHKKYYKEIRILRSDGAVRWLAAHGECFYNDGGEPTRLIGLAEDVTEARQQVEKQRVLVAELQHRTRNLLAVVQAIMQHTMQTADSLGDFENRFNHRLAALSRVQNLLSRSDNEPLTMGALVGMELSALGFPTPNDRVKLAGPKALVCTGSVQTIFLVIHELTTNSLKYGALANKDGRLSVTWRVEGTNPERRLLLEWIENGVAAMPPAAERPRRGYGRTLIEEALPYTLSARTKFELGTEGLRCVISIPLAISDEGEVAV